MRAYQYRHIVSFEETNLLGNVYYASHIIWQGRVRELFLREYLPEILQEFERGLRIVTTRVSCDYYLELFAFDEIIIRMYASAITRSRITMLFQYYRDTPQGEELIAQGEQQIAFMRHIANHAQPIPVPEKLGAALQQFIWPG
ncbi:MAG: acyl-CoA thioesterase [Methylococcales bacterium]|nr:acyl-CoA thioesterase [Methylococcales bacterium]